MKLRFQSDLAPFAQLPAPALADALGGPTLFDLRKSGVAPIFVSVLVHGNEPSGWDAARRLHRELAAASSIVFVGNVEAAKAGVRALPGRADLNRVWEGGDAAETALAEQVASFAAAAAPRFAIDIHNTTGRNPPYAVVARTDRRTLALARAFSALALLGTQPPGFQTRRFAAFCPAATVEVGTMDDPASTDRAAAFLSRLLRLEAAADPASLVLYETAARVTVSDDAVLEPRTQCFNFRAAPPGTVLAKAGELAAWSADGRDVGGDYLRRGNGATRLCRETALAMYTPDAAAARSDCLCYLLRKVSNGAAS